MRGGLLLLLRSTQVSRAILGEKKPLTKRPSAALPPADFAKVKAELQGQIADVLGDVTDELVVSSLLYPKVCGVGVHFVVCSRTHTNAAAWYETARQRGTNVGVTLSDLFHGVVIHRAD